MEVLERSREIALRELDYVYLGNLGTGDYVNTFCPGCGSKIVERSRGIKVQGLGRCANCGQAEFNNETRDYCSRRITEEFFSEYYQGSLTWECF